MKKLTLCILSLIFLLCAAFGLVGCGKEKHTHSFTEQKVEQQYLASAATCTEATKYYYSCTCGEKGTETFTSGNALGHSFTDYIPDNNATCTQDGTKTATCDHKGCHETDTITDAGSKLTHVEGDLKYDVKPGADLLSATIKESVYCELCKELITINSYEITLPSQTFSYDGQSHSLAFEGDEIPERIKPVFVGNEQTSAGDYTVTVGFVDEETETVFKVVLTAELKINKDGKYHEVVFAYDDAATANVSIAVKHGEKIPESQYPELPQKQGYTVKWVFDDTAIVDDTTISILYIPIEYKITYVLDGASNNPRNPHAYTFESPAITLYAPESEAGLSFQGWYTSPKFEASARVSTIASGTTGNLTLYAYFLKFKVEAADGFTFDYKSYDYPALTQTVSSTKNTITLSTTIQVSKGCTWTLSRDIEGSDVIKTKNMSLKEGHNIAYITVWYGEGDYNLVYYLDIYRLGHRSYSFVADGVTVFPEKTVEEQTYVSAPAAPEKPGYTFNGWYALSLNLEEIDFSSLIPDKPVTFPYRLDYDTKFLAIFKPNVYTATYDENGGKPLAQKTENVTFDTTFVPAEPERDGYTFIGWQDSEGNVFKSLPQWKYLASETFTAQWELNTYSISYVLNGGVNPENTVYEYTILDETVTLLSPSKTGYDFCGWFVDADFKKQVAEIAHGSFENKKFYAKWTPTVYEITYVLNGGENDEGNPTDYTIESDDITLSAPTKTGYMGSWLEGNKLPKGSTGNKIFTAVYTPDVTLSNDGTIVTGLRNTSITNLIILSEYNGIQVTKIGDNAFKNCSGLTSVTIGNSVTSIGSDAFSGCSGLTKVIWNAENCITAGSSNNPIFKNCSNLTTLIIGNNVKVIPAYAFYGCSGLTSVTIGNSVTSIGSDAFSGCTGLTSITIPYSVTSIGDYAFYNCIGLTSITIPDSVTSIGKEVFRNCSGLTSITIPDSVTSIGYSAFKGCDNLKYLQLQAFRRQRCIGVSVDAFFHATLRERVFLRQNTLSVNL